MTSEIQGPIPSSIEVVQTVKTPSLSFILIAISRQKSLTTHILKHTSSGAEAFKIHYQNWQQLGSPFDCFHISINGSSYITIP